MEGEGGYGEEKVGNKFRDRILKLISKIVLGLYVLSFRLLDSCVKSR